MTLRRGPQSENRDSSVPNRGIWCLSSRFYCMPLKNPLKAWRHLVNVQIHFVIAKVIFLAKINPTLTRIMAFSKKIKMLSEQANLGSAAPDGCLFFCQVGRKTVCELIN